jgi:AsmA-like C-terminal region
VPARVVDEKHPHRRKWFVISAVAALLVTGAVVLTSVYDAGPILHGRVVQTLTDKFKSRVELGAFHVTISHGLDVSGRNLRIYGQDDPNSHQPGTQPLFSIAVFNFHIGIWNLLKSPTHVDTVFVQGLAINIPPANDRQQMAPIRPGKGRAKVLVDHFVCDHAELVINTSSAGKLPLVFDIQNLVLDETAPGQSLRFRADLVNPKPVGLIHTVGLFGPWRSDKPQDTPVQGEYSFRDADLGTIHGIGGILSSKGAYGGTLDRIVVDGTTDTPDFQVTRSRHRVPLKTEFHAVVDATSGDTYLQPVRAKVAHSSLIADGFVVRVANPPGHRVNLKVDITGGRIDDLLLLGVRTDPPVMTGKVRLSTTFDLPSGEQDLSDRLKLKGTFQVSGAHFSSDKIQDKIGALSLRSQGKPKLVKTDASDAILSEVGGEFALNQGVLSFSRLQFRVPGTEVNMRGRYSLDGNEFDFHGKARLQAKLSHMTTGWKSILLKPVDPFFNKNGAGTELPVKITGTKSEPHFGLDFGHHNVRD